MRKKERYETVDDYCMLSPYPPMLGPTIDIERCKNRLLKFFMCPLLAQLIIGLFFLFLLWPFTVLMKQTRQTVRAVKQSMFLDIYGAY